MQLARKHITDSVASIRKYKESRRYRDSVTKAQNAKTKAVTKARQSRMDSIADARKAITDSLASARKTKTDSIRNVQKKRSDSLGRITKYKTSKRYADSVTIVRKLRSDSIKTVQQANRDKLAATRKHSLDSAKTSRTRILDSVKAVRTKSLDSIKMVRKAKTDSLAKVRKLKENLAKSKEKTKEEDKKLQLELKIKQKRQEWSNAKMLKKKWGPIRRFTQNSFTHYNYYFNAKKKMAEAEANMARTHKENYDSLIGLYSFDPNRDSAAMSQDMDTIIRKISVGIQIHDPRVKWAPDLYLLLGQAYYYRGQYENAAIAFRYIISADEEKKKAKAKKQGYSKSKEAATIVESDKKRGMLDFLKHKSVHNDAILWLAHTYTEAQQVENAESILSLLESDTKLPGDLQSKLAIEKAFVYLNENNQPSAAAQLAIAIADDDLPSHLRMRAAFILGQLLQNMGEYKDAAVTFEKVLTYYPKLEMDFYARKYVAFNRLQAGDNVDEAMRPLKKVLKDGKYVSYYDQVYFVLGQLAAKANQNTQAITYYTKSVNTPRATKKQKATSYAAMGDVYYGINNYNAAKRAYDSAAKYSSGKEAGIAVAIQRSKGLEEISGPTKVIHDQDSLLSLSRLSQREQQAIVRRYLRDMERKRLDSIARAESTGVVAAAPTETEADKEAASWYFGNPTLMQQGSAEFKRKWGNRPLVDNWRRNASIPLTSTRSSSTEDDLDELASAANDNGELTEENLLSKIPNTPQQKEVAVKLQQRAYMQLAKAYFKLEDYDMTVHTLDTLDRRFPTHNYYEDGLFLRYQVAMKQNKLDQAKKYADELMAKFPSSQYASIVRPGQSEAKQADMIGGKTVSAYFDETYDLLLKHQYTEALMRINVAKKQFDNPTYKKRFDVAEAMGYAGAGRYDEADTAIASFLRTHPSDTLTPWALTIRNYIKEVRNGGKPSWYKEGPYIPKKADTAPGTAATASGGTVADSTGSAKTKASEPPPPAEIPPSFSYRQDTPHYCIVLLPGIDSRTAGFKKAVRDFNAAKYPSASFELLFDLLNIDQAALIVKKFSNGTEAKKYLTDLLAAGVLKDYETGEAQAVIVSGINYKKIFADKDAAEYLNFYNANYK